MDIVGFGRVRLLPNPPKTAEAYVTCIAVSGSIIREGYAAMRLVLKLSAILVIALTSIGACTAATEYTLLKADPASKITYISPAYSPDGVHIAYVRRVNFKSGNQFVNAGMSLYIAKLTGEGWAHTRIADRADSPVWSPDGKYLAFDRQGVALRDDSSGKIRQLTRSRYPKSSGRDKAAAYYDTPLNFSPDGRYIAYTRALYEGSELRIFDTKLNRDFELKHSGILDWGPKSKYALVAWRWFMDDSRTPTSLVMFDPVTRKYCTVLKNYRVAKVIQPKSEHSIWVVLESPLPEGPGTDLAPPQGPGLYSLDISTRKLSKIADMDGWISVSRHEGGLAWIAHANSKDQAPELRIGSTQRWTTYSYTKDISVPLNQSDIGQSFSWSPSGQAFAYVSKSGDIRIAGKVLFHGVAVTPSGKPIRGAYIAFAETGNISYISHTSADECGRFKLSLKPGEYDVWVPGAKVKKVHLIVSHDTAPDNLIVTGREDEYITFAFLKPDGTPAAKSKILMSMGYSPETDEKGELQDRGSFDAPRRFHVIAPGLGYGECAFNDDSEIYNTSKVTIQLHTGGTITGIVREKGTGRPIGGREICPFYKDGHSPWGSFWNSMMEVDVKGVHVSVGPLATISRDGDGRYVLRDLIPGDYELATCFNNKPVVQFSINDSELTHTIDITVPPQGDDRSVSGRVLRDTARKPITNTEVTFVVRLDADKTEGVAWHFVKRKFVTDSHGNFRLYPLEPGVYWITASTPSYGTSDRMMVDLSSERKTDMDIVLTRKPRR